MPGLKTTENAVTVVLTGELLPVGPPHTTPVSAGTTGTAGVGEVEQLLREWLIGYGSANTRDAYERDVRRWLGFLADVGVDPLHAARRVHAHAWLRTQEAAGDAPASRARRLAAVSAWHAWMIAEEHTDRANPAAIDPKRKPKAPTRSSTAGLTREQAMALLAAADADPGTQAARTAAIVAVLLFTGLRVGELVDADVDQLGHDRNHRVLRVRAKGDQQHLVVLARPAAARLDAYLAGRGDLTGDRLLVPAGQAGTRPAGP